MNSFNMVKERPRVVMRLGTTHSALVVKNNSRSWALAAVMCGLMALACLIDEAK